MKNITAELSTVHTAIAKLHEQFISIAQSDDERIYDALFALQQIAVTEWRKIANIIDDGNVYEITSNAAYRSAAEMLAEMSDVLMMRRM